MPKETSLRALPAPETNGFVPAVPEFIPIQPSYGYAPEPEENVVPLSHYLWILRRHKWRIVAFVLVCVASTVVVSSRLTPIYEATATIDIDRQAPAAVGVEVDHRPQDPRVRCDHRGDGGHRAGARGP